MKKLLRQSTNEVIPEGSHQGVCTGVYYLGKQYSEMYGKEADKILFSWELPDVRLDTKDGDFPRLISKIYTASLHEKASLSRDLESWLGRSLPEAFDPESLLGKNCVLQVIHKNGKPRITNITPLLGGLQPVEPEGDTRLYSFMPGEKIPERTSEWISDMIKAAVNWPPQEAATEEEEIPDDDIPF